MTVPGLYRYHRFNALEKACPCHRVKLKTTGNLLALFVIRVAGSGSNNGAEDRVAAAAVTEATLGAVRGRSGQDVVRGRARRERRGGSSLTLHLVDASEYNFL